MSKNRAWCFTVNYLENVTPANELIISGAAYSCYQLEIAPETGRRHHQGYVYFTNAVRLATVRERISSVAGAIPHCEIAKGTAEQNKTYCSKPASAVPGTFREHGSIPKQGKRSDLDSIAEAIMEGSSMAEIAVSFPSDFIRYNRGLQELERVHLCKDRDHSTPNTVLWWYGPTGSGKSRTAFETYPDAYVKMGNGKWWDGYRGETVVLIDDYRPGFCLFSELLRILDRYPMRVEAKGTSMPLSAKTFIITTTSRPEVLWAQRVEEDLNQLIRRITEIVEFTPGGEKLVHKSATVGYVATLPTSLAPGFNPVRVDLTQYQGQHLDN